jgi:outer membrane lipoprotein-sorting protein
MLIKKDDSISLCIDTENLWVSNDKEVWKMDFEGNNKTVVVTLDDLKKVNDSSWELMA